MNNLNQIPKMEPIGQQCARTICHVISDKWFGVVMAVGAGVGQGGGTRRARCVGGGA